MDTSQIQIVYRPRIRMWRQRDGSLHLGGEPDGLSLLLGALKALMRGHKKSVRVELVSTEIQRGRNPVRGPISEVYAFLTVKYRRSVGPAIIMMADEGGVRLGVGDEGLRDFYVAVSEACDGEGDFSIRVTEQRVRAKKSPDKILKMWFWGYANVHGANGF